MPKLLDEIHPGEILLEDFSRKRRAAPKFS
jgi:hypothetical protein